LEREDWSRTLNPTLLARFQWEGLGNAWIVRGDVHDHGKGLVIGCLAIKETDYHDPEGIKKELLRKIPTGSLLREVISQLTYEKRLLRAGDALGFATPPELQPSRRKVASALKRTPRGPGRPALTDERLRQVAIDYLEEQDRDGRGIGIHERIADRWWRRGRDVSEKTVQGWVRRAEHAGWLTRAIPGRLGRAPGPRLQAERAQRKRGAAR